jgi:hypothetical protein
LGCALAFVEFANSSLQAIDPLATLAVIFWLAIVLLVSPDSVAIALIVALDVIRNGAMYCVDVDVGVLLSVV